VLIRNCVFFYNQASHGGAAYTNTTFDTVKFVDCTFIRNGGHGSVAADQEADGATVDTAGMDGGLAPPGHGGAIFCQYRTRVVLDHCVLSGNVAYYGGALAAGDGGILYARNCTLTKNFARYDGAASYQYRDGRIRYWNCIIGFNTGSQALTCAIFSRTWLVCCDVVGNEWGDWTGCVADQAEIDGNFSAPPQFCSLSDGRHYLQPDSPCLPANNACGELVGALGVGCENFLCGDVNQDGYVTISDLTYLMEYYFEYTDTWVPSDKGDLSCDGLFGLNDIVQLADFLSGRAAARCCDQ
jgi:hypothetical protein